MLAPLSVDTEEAVGAAGALEEGAEEMPGTGGLGGGLSGVGGWQRIGRVVGVTWGVLSPAAGKAGGGPAVGGSAAGKKFG